VKTEPRKRDTDGRLKLAVFIAVAFVIASLIILGLSRMPKAEDGIVADPAAQAAPQR
jgi:hypothetical protein